MSRYGVFVYGTLLDADLRCEVCGRSVPAAPARLPDYRRYRLRNLPYPGIVAEPGAEVVGQLLDVDARTLAALDRYEDSCYERRLLEVDSEAGRQRAYVYVIPQARRHLIDPRDWDLDRWRRWARRRG
ncbi:gamma-glutamylcyclotransferase (GGCT)/AIG2-like uncharacterized protein YtfP [Methylohalomonas lacus]|uniref:Putative gamma-glutamylcyclotransferase n=2 Tax=Methylohalomonas lacus TaxID=398773 RepID=A0AAE3HNV9_9GAMM|nr:gamma-glutamylcyclotransferase (GGCT)/AIG2-like uncharacterized protein YtfP [Methylohalomonas lacus]